MIADAVVGISPGRRLTPERASQNVLASRPPTRDKAQRRKPSHARLIVTANYDAGRTALIYRDPLREPRRALRRLTGGGGPGWLAWLSIALAWPLAIAIVRMSQTHAAAVLGALQLPPTVALVLALALLLEAAGAAFGPAAGDNGTGVATAIALARALAADPPRNLAVELVLQGAGDGEQLGLRRYLRAHRRELRTQSAIVLGIAACGAGQPSWWLSDGPLVPLRYARRLRALCSADRRRPPPRPRRRAGAAGARRRPARDRDRHASTIADSRPGHTNDRDTPDANRPRAARPTRSSLD